MSQLARTTPSPAVPTTSSPLPFAPRTPSSAPAAPSAQRAQEATPNGSWKHPNFDEITRRQYATNFDERNVRIILANLSFLVFSVVAPTVTSQVALLRSLAKPLQAIVHTIPYNKWAVSTIQLILLANILVALSPLARRYYPDDIADIALTSSQRQQMGLNPDVAPPQTPGSAYATPNYVTPPRYQKSTPRSSFSNQGGGSQSPLSGSPRASMRKSTSNSPFSPNTGSPLFQKAVGGGSASKRLSYGGSPLTSSWFNDSSSSATPGTPTPGTGKASVGLNNKWLYEKRRDSPRSSLFN